MGYQLPSSLTMAHSPNQVNLVNIVNIPHGTTGRSPAELLFNRKFRGKIPDLSIDHAYDHELHDRDAEQKAKTKDYADTQRRANHSNVEAGDEVLVKQDKTNKLSTALNPNPFKVISKRGNSLVTESPAGNQYSRNTSHVKRYITEGGPASQQESDVLATPASLPEEAPVTGPLNSEVYLDTPENVGGKIRDTKYPAAPEDTQITREIERLCC